ncbi:hypothetical protein Tco_0906005, partial [Tanacetum coccineum]
MNDPNITMEEYIRLKEEKPRRSGKVYNWETAAYGKIWDNEDVHDLGSVETEFPAIVFNDTLTSEAALSCDPTASSLNNDEIDFRISFGDSDDEDYTNEFPAIVYNDALTSKSDFSTEPTLSRQHNHEFDLKDKTSLSECDEEEQNVLNFNDLFPFNVIYPNDSKSDKNNDDDKVDIKQSSGNLSIKLLPDVINTDVGAYAHGYQYGVSWGMDTAYRPPEPSERKDLVDCIFSGILQAVPTNAARKVNTVKPIVNNARPKAGFHKTLSPFRKPFNKTTALRTNFSYQKVNTAEVNAVSVVEGKRETAVKPSAGCNWRHKKYYWNKVSKYNGGSSSRNYVPFKDPLGRPKPKKAWVTDQAKEIKHLKAQIKKLKKKAKPTITHHKAWMKSVSMKQRLVGNKSLKKQWMQKESLDDDTIDYMETEDAQDVGRTSYVVHKKKESVEKGVSTEDPLSTAQPKVSTNKPEDSTDKPDEGIDKPKVSTDKEEVSTDRPEEGTVDQNEGRSATQTAPTTTTPTIFGDVETIAQVLIIMSQNKEKLKEKEKGVEL